MTNAQLKNISNAYYRRLKNISLLLVKDFDKEIIHQFRVEYKRLRAFLRLMALAPGSAEELKLNKLLKKAYHVAGEMRDLQLQLQRILTAANRDNKKAAAYLNILSAEIEKLKPELTELFRNDPVTMSKKRTGQLLPEKFLPPQFKRYVQRQWLVVTNNFRSARHPDDTIHLIRKSLKDMLYNLNNYKGITRQVLAVTICKGREETYFEGVQAILGQYQDQCTAIALLRSYWLQKVPVKERQFLEKLKTRWISEKISAKQALLKELRTVILPANRKNK